MNYEGVLYRPPSEARSLIIQATVGCAHNGCTFCSMYKDKKFRIKKIEDILKEIEASAQIYGSMEKIFIADGDAMIMKTEDQVSILDKIREYYPRCKRVGIYATPKALMMKSSEELIRLREKGIGIVYMGIESGDDETLKAINKGATADEIVQAGRKVKDAGIALSVTLISSIAGKEKSEQHAVKSAEIVSLINPQYTSFLTLMLENNTPLYDDYLSGNFRMLSEEEIMKEIRLFLENVDAPGCIFRANHASNYVALAGTLNEDKERLISEIDEALREQDFKPEYLRGL